MIFLKNVVYLFGLFIPSLIKKIHLAKIKKKSSILLWGTGIAKREVIYVDDLADAVIYFMNKKVKHHLINIGSSKEKSIKEISKLILKVRARVGIHREF